MQIVTLHSIQNTASNGIGLWLAPARDDWRLSSESKADPGQCVSGLRSIRVWSASSLRSLSSCECLLRACHVFALHPRSVHTERGRRAFCVHCAFKTRSPRVNAAWTLRSHWFFRKWVTLNAACTQLKSRVCIVLYKSKLQNVVIFRGLRPPESLTRGLPLDPTGASSHTILKARSTTLAQIFPSYIILSRSLRSSSTTISAPMRKTSIATSRFFHPLHLMSGISCLSMFPLPQRCQFSEGKHHLFLHV